MSSFKTKTVSWCAEPVNIPGIPLKAYNSEIAFQVYCADWLRKQYELTKDGRYAHWHHSANERMGLKAGFLAKMMGQSKGWPDFVQPGLKLAIELKVPGGVVSVEQGRWLEYFKSIGWRAEVVYSFEGFRAIVEGS